MLRTSDGVLDRFTRDLTAEARRGRLDVVRCRDSELARLIDILLRRDKNNPVLVGEAGVGKTAIAEALASRLAHDDVPLGLRGRRLLALDHMALLGGTMYRGQYEGRLRDLIAQVVEAGDVILFVDELHNLVGQGTAVGVPMDAANMLKPALVRGEFRVLGATTAAEYERWIRPDPALERRFQPVAVRELSSAETAEVLETRRAAFEQHHFVAIADDALRAAVLLTDLFQPERHRPDRALDALDEACAHVHARATYSTATEALIERLRGSRREGTAATGVDADAEALRRLARGGVAALDRLGAELDAVFGLAPASPRAEPGVSPHAAERAAGSTPDVTAAAASDAVRAELRSRLVEEGVVVRGHDVARVVSLTTGKNVSWSE